MKIVTIMERPELERLQYGVVVEQWKHIGYGRGKRLFEAEFNEEERKQVRALYKVYSRWHGGWTGGGLPDTHAMTVREYQFALRVSDFFGVTL